MKYIVIKFVLIRDLTCTIMCSPFRLRQIDIHFMKRLHHKVNIVPIIAKADTLTRPELIRMKARVLDQIKANDIHIYQFPECDSDEDEEFLKQDRELKVTLLVYQGHMRVRSRLFDSFINF